MRRNRQRIVGLTLAVVGLAFTGCTPGAGVQGHGPNPRTASLRLVAYDSCDAAMRSLKAAARVATRQHRGTAVPIARPAVGPGQAGTAGSAAAAAPSTGTVAPDYSGTNVHEPGVDEPDIVKTDGGSIVTVTSNVLHVVDAASRRVTGEVLLPSHSGAPPELLLRGDWALVLFRSTSIATPIAAPMAWGDQQPDTADVVVVDLSGRQPRLAGTLTVDGSLVDARQVAGVARLVVRSTPRVDAGSAAAIDTATISDWLPRYRLSLDGRTTSGSVDCRHVNRPLHYSGLTMLTVYSIDLDAAPLTVGDPATVVADGGVVYGTSDSLYIAAADRSMAEGIGGQLTPLGTQTQIYEFDVSRPGRPVFEASGEVPGSLIDQYAMSEYDGTLRVVTTAGGGVPAGPSPATSESALRVLQRRGEDLSEIGRLEGLGRGERVYSVRFVGPTGYVVTFRQTDPLYVVDLGDPANPVAVGELQLTGYSAYLHPAGDGRLIGVGQEANARGRVLGTQVSLFDVSDPSKPDLIARYQLNGGHSEAEVDPHAFLFWPKTGLVLIPVTPNRNGALALTTDGATLHELGRVGPGRQIRRSLVIGDSLWTVTDGGLGVNQVTTLAVEGWIPFPSNG